MKRSAPTPVQTTVQAEIPSLSLGVIRTALIGMSFVVLLLLGLFCFFRARTQHMAPLATPTPARAPLLRMASVVTATQRVN
ncbi:MAG: hypothetical protein EOO60_00120 [Hymenobacter sp.]|nr:MAG: hypothetical protein EOO60_00120 [Hymenobacter sp.]